MFSKYIIDWYSEFGRELPWRNTKDPYLIWISEIILQQTRVAQGYNYYLRFIDRYPTVQKLAESSEQEVLKYWQGLGYYSRARNLLAAAQSISGNFPSTYADVISLKGVGEYTAAAICSFAFDLPYAVVDGNVYRVLSRYYGVSTPINTSKGKKEFSELAQGLIDKKYPAKYNQAIMDFGAIQCTPKSPKCQECPLVDSCVAYNESKIQDLPVKQGKTKVRNRYFNYFYIVDTDGSIFLNKRIGSDIWKNMFDFPLIETEKSVELEELLNQESFLSDLNLSDISSVVQNYQHVLSHQKIFAKIYTVKLTKKYINLTNYLKINIDDLDLYPVPKLIHQFLQNIVE